MIHRVSGAASHAIDDRSIGTLLIPREIQEMYFTNSVGYLNMHLNRTVGWLSVILGSNGKHTCSCVKATHKLLLQVFKRANLHHE